MRTVVPKNAILHQPKCGKVKLLRLRAREFLTLLLYMGNRNTLSYLSHLEKDPYMASYFAGFVPSNSTRPEGECYWDREVAARAAGFSRTYLRIIPNNSNNVFFIHNKLVCVCVCVCVRVFVYFRRLVSGWLRKKGGNK